MVSCAAKSYVLVIQSPCSTCRRTRPSRLALRPSRKANAARFPRAFRLYLREQTLARRHLMRRCTQLCSTGNANVRATSRSA
jgi:hypothetical protein